MEAVAREKFACPACGAEAHWNPDKQSLVCPYCGTTAPMEAPPDSGTGAKEHDLVAALRSLPDEKRGWKSPKVSVKCQSCQAISVFDPARVAQRCEFCGSAQIVPYDQVKPPISPESLLPFQLDQPRVRDGLKRWYGSRWFAPNRLKSAALTDTLQGAYLPYWTFDARVHAQWQAESGYHYYTTETYRDSNGQTRTRRVQHTRWQSSSGQLEHFFDDELICASRGVHANLLREVEPFPTKELVAYQPSFVAGWVVEQYQLDLVGAAAQSRDRMEKQVYALCGSQVPGDTYRNLRVQSNFTQQTFKHVLLPVWFVTYNYGTKSYQVLVNGVTGELAGEYPKSFWKIFFLIVFISILALVFYAVAR
jgi:ribosomal protein S27E